jgi:tetratricopeptide (TPR) repeat protein
MTPDSSPAHLAELRRRWQAEPGSRLFLQLAEEYRRADRHAEAVEVLEKGLEQHPNHVSAHVALGRVRLDMGEPGSAAQALERALELDVTNLVANKLLIEAYLGRGEKERARQRLELYRLLNDSDPDVADLRRRIDGGRTVAPSPPERDAAAGEVTFGADDTAAGVASPADEVLAEGRSWGGEATADSLEPPAGEPAGRAPAGSDTAASDTARAPAAFDGGRGAVDALQEEPMTTGTGPADAWDGRGAEREAAGSAGGRGSDAGQPFGDLAAGGAERRYLEALGGEGLFALPPSAPPPSSDAPPESLPEPRPAEVEALTEEAPSTEETRPAAAPGPAAEAAPAGTRQPDERPTVTLGQLYLDQGHFAQSRRVFAALLDEEPDHEVARRGLDRAERELAASGPEPLTAAELLRDAAPEQPARRALLGAYLARILRSRESRPSDVPR